MEESITWRNFLNGDKHAFEALFTLYYKPLFQYGYKMVKDRLLLDDCIQDLFFELWTTREQLGEVQSVKGYLFKALKYKLYREMRKALKREDLEEYPEDLLEFSYEALLIEEETKSDRHQQLQYLMQKLSKRQQEALFLRFYSQLSYEEIGEIMAISYQATVNLVYKSIRFLRENMILLYTLLIVMLLF